MPNPVMNEYRAKKIEEEIYSSKSFRRPCELLLKHGKDRLSYWGIPEIEQVTEIEEKGVKLTLMSILWKTRRDVPARFGLMLPMGMTLQNVMQPCKYMETDRGYQNIISAVIGGLILLNVADFYMMVTMSDLGAAAFASPAFLVPATGVFSMILALAFFNQTHYTYRLSVECHDPEDEPADAHFVYAIDCDVPVPKQLAWIANHPELEKKVVETHAEKLGYYHLDLRSQVAQAQKEKQDMLKDRRFERLFKKDQELTTRQTSSIWDNPTTWVLCIIVAALAAALFWIAAGGR